MATCEVCGNDYDGAFEVHMGNGTHVFDCFECAIQKLAPRCGHCGVRVIGHGIEGDGSVFCCAHCARQEGMQEAVDRL